MLQGPTVIAAVLTTLLRATADAQTPVVLRTRRAEQARELACWLEQAHGSRRTVIPSVSAVGAIEVRLPARMRWPAPVREGHLPGPPLATAQPTAHLSQMHTQSPPASDR